MIILIMFNFIGKGGVGKTTSAALSAISLSNKGKTLVVSLDPAHNLGDVLGVELSEEPKRIAPGLWASEPDVDKIIREYAKNISEEFKQHYKYLRVLNLDKVFDVLEHTPGVEEQALLQKLMELKNTDFDYVVVDNAPTGIALRVLLLPQIMLTWMNYLLKLRKDIVKRREIVEEKKVHDPVLELLEKEIQELEEFDKYLKSKHHKVILVLNAEEMPVLEAIRIKDTLNKFSMKPCAVIVNKLIIQDTSDPTLVSMKESQQKWLKKIHEEFKDMQIVKLPYLPVPPKGVERLRELAKEYLGEGICKV
ncbi:anion transporter [Ignicoccus pacificus DSM 13166]|uniref:Anion transporter n=1 Tax=Ignicoccus pacificus DSM 13166 TaxID=940294 RepID=A0A977K9L2_9CREN|nr:anion transporter [Ignicoccus pacificus DSM 13166]